MSMYDDLFEAIGSLLASCLQAWVFFAGVICTLLVYWALYTFNPEPMIPSRYECGMRTRDGCVAWTDPVRIERFEQGKVGT